MEAYVVIHALQQLYWRNTNYTFNRFFSAVLFGLLLGSVYFNLPYDTVADYGARAGLLFAMCYLGGAVYAGHAISIVLTVKAMIMREKQLRRLNGLLYNVAFTLAEIPYLALTSLAFVGITCGMANVAVGSAKDFLAFWFTVFLLGLAIAYLGLLLAVAAPKPPIAFTMVSLITSLWIVSAGYVLPLQLMKKVFVWLFWINPLQYALNTMTILAFYCDTKSPQCSLASCSTNPAVCPACTCERVLDSDNVFVWDTIKSQRSLEMERRMGLDWIYLIAFSIICRFLTYMALRYLRHNQAK